MWILLKESLLSQRFIGIAYIAVRQNVPWLFPILSRSVYFEMTQQYPTKTLAETCHSGFKCMKDKKNLRHGYLNPPGNLRVTCIIILHFMKWTTNSNVLTSMDYKINVIYENPNKD